MMMWNISDSLSDSIHIAVCCISLMLLAYFSVCIVIVCQNHWGPGCAICSGARTCACLEVVLGVITALATVKVSESLA